jgi:hypothetical protein
LLRSRDRAWLFISAAFVALLAVTHNITALYVLPLLALYLVLMAWHEHVFSRLPTAAAALALGLGLSAFYWLPAIAERGYIRLGGIVGGDFDATRNLFPLVKIVQPSLVFHYWGGLAFHFALSQVLLATVSILATAFQPKSLRFTLGVWAGALTLILFLLSDLSQPLWQVVPLVRYIQFPWRLLGPAALLVALLSGSLLCWRHMSRIAGLIVVPAILAFIFYTGTRDLQPPFRPDLFHITDAQIGKQDIYERGPAFPLYGDYLPVSLTCELARSRPSEAPALPPLVAQPAVQITSDGANSLRLRIDAPVPFTLRLPRIYFPNWQVYAAGHLVATGAGGLCGLVTVALPAGEYPVVAQFVDTPLRRTANAISLLGLLALAAGTVRIHSLRPALWVIVFLAVILACLALRHQGLGQPPRQPVALTAQFEDGISLLGYHLEHETLRPGATLTLRLYWLANKTPAEDYKVFVHLVKPDDVETVAQADSAPVLGYSPTSRWDPGELVVDEHQVPIGGDVTPGIYRIVIGIYRPETLQNLRVAGAREILPGDRVVLRDVEVLGE